LRRLRIASKIDREVSRSSGGGAGMIDVENRAQSGDRDAVLALDVMLHHLASAVAAMAASAGGLDALAFTAGIGEGAALVRERLCARLGFLGVELDRGRNQNVAPDCDVSTDRSRVRVLVVRAREELIAARAARTLLSLD